ncbi:hypothetical protein Hamer_G013542, partial [Homarus americanus]
KKSVWRQIQALGLKPQYEADEDYRLFCGQADGLVFLPPEAKEDMQYFGSTMPDETAALLEYSNATRVTEQLRHNRTTVFSLESSRLSACDARHQCSHMRSVTCSRSPLTTNLEQTTSAEVWKLTYCLQVENARVDAVLLQEERGIRPTKRVNKAYDELQGRLRSFCLYRKEGIKTTPELLRGISHDLRRGQPKV